jgi:L-Ala-D/L-Glu epimerase
MGHGVNPQEEPALTPARLSWEMVTLRLRNPFHISYGVSDTRQAFIIRLEDGSGFGEGTIPPYYHIHQKDMIAYWQEAAASKVPFPVDPDEIPAWVGFTGPAPARSAVDLALHDRIARQRGIPLFRLLEFPPPVVMPTSFTISLDSPEKMAEMALKISNYPIIKVKLGSHDDAACLAAVRRARPDARLRVDANAGWTYAEAVARIEQLLPYELEMIEQPLGRAEFEEMGRLQHICPVPLVADESVQTLQDVDRLAEAGVQGINLKLMKVGGLAPAVAILRRAQQLGLRVMLGCMIETSLGATAMAHLTGAAEWIDLDAPLLIQNDPFDGVRYDDRGGLHLPHRPGIGAVERQVKIEEQA